MANSVIKSQNGNYISFIDMEKGTRRRIFKHGWESSQYKWDTSDFPCEIMASLTHGDEGYGVIYEGTQADCWKTIGAISLVDGTSNWGHIHFEIEAVQLTYTLNVDFRFSLLESRDWCNNWFNACTNTLELMRRYLIVHEWDKRWSPYYHKAPYSFVGVDNWDKIKARCFENDGLINQEAILSFWLSNFNNYNDVLYFVEVFDQRYPIIELQFMKELSKKNPPILIDDPNGDLDAEFTEPWFK